MRISDWSSDVCSSDLTWKFLPSATAIFDVTDKLRLRFNYGKTLRRPAFGDLNSNFNLTGDLTQVGYGSGSAGNPNLRSTQSTNYDLSLEWYFDRDSAIYTTLRSEEHTSELQSLMRISYAVFCLKIKTLSI